MKKIFNKLKIFFSKKEKKKNKEYCYFEKEINNKTKIKNNELEKINELIEKKLKKSLIILDKKAGKTSAEEVYNLRRILKLGKKNKNIKIGHSGTLDPKVTGVLVIGLGSGTKVLEYILLAEKQYETEIIFHKKVLRKDFIKALKEFTGTITQLPPLKSAVKRKERKREVYDLKLIYFSPDGRSAKFISSVERGTYMRKLCHDIGIFLKIGAHMGELRRIKAGYFSLRNSKIITTEKIKKLYNSDKIEDKRELLNYFYDIEELFLRINNDKVKKIFIKNESLIYIKSGNPIRNKNIEKEIMKKDFLNNFKKCQIVSIFVLNKKLKEEVIAIGEVIEELSIEQKDEENEVIKIKKNF